MVRQVMAQPFAEPCGRGVITTAPFVRAAKHVVPHRRSMVLTACVLASAMAFIDGSALTLIGGALADVYGKARVLAAGCVAFGLASAACIVAPSIEWLIAVRIVQGASSAIVTPASLALIGATFPKSERSRAIGVWAAASALTTAGGPVLGGWLTESFGWQWVFAINPPLALVAIGLVLKFAPPDRRVRRGFDLVGAGILTCGLALIAWALSQLGPGAASERVPIAAGAGLGLAAIAAYAWWETVSDHPMTPPWLLRNRVFVGLNAATLLLYCGLSIMFFLVSFDLIDRRGLSPTAAGLAFLPFTLAMGFLSRMFGAMADKFGARIMLIVGPLGAAFAFVLLALGKTAPLVWGVLAPLTLLGLAFAVMVAPLTAAVMSSVANKDEGLASGVNNAVARIAQLAGIALAAGLASNSSGYRVSMIIAAALAALAALATAAIVPAAGRRRR